MNKNTHLNQISVDSRVLVRLIIFLAALRCISGFRRCSRARLSFEFNSKSIWFSLFIVQGNRYGIRYAPGTYTWCAPDHCNYANSWWARIDRSASPAQSSIGNIRSRCISWNEFRSGNFLRTSWTARHNYDNAEIVAEIRKYESYDEAAMDQVDWIFARGFRHASIAGRSCHYGKTYNSFLSSCLNE